jgi:hypothetical protein
LSKFAFGALKGDVRLHPGWILTGLGHDHGIKKHRAGIVDKGQMKGVTGVCPGL